VRLADLSADLGGGVFLRPLDEDDVPELFMLTERNREHLRHWLPWVDMTLAEEDTRAFVRSVGAAIEAGLSVQFALVVDGRIVGVAGFHELDRVNDAVALGYWIAQEHQGRGLMTRAVEALVRIAFEKLGLNRVVIQAAVENGKSRAIAERLGFREEGVLREAERHSDSYFDLATYSLLAREWRERT
jgi:ribosomal-protein-serine acetyltransferase